MQMMPDRQTLHSAIAFLRWCLTPVWFCVALIPWLGSLLQIFFNSYHVSAFGGNMDWHVIMPIVYTTITYACAHVAIQELRKADFSFWRTVTVRQLALNISIVLASLGIVAGVML
jgi:hypothetical protein